MRNLEKIDALVVSRRNIGETDRIVTFLVPGRGLLRAFANGVRKIPSRRGGHIEPVTRVTLLLSGRDGRYSVGAIETVDYFHQLRKNAGAMDQAQTLSRLLLGLFGVEGGENGLFHTINQAWHRLSIENDQKRAMLEISVSWDLLRVAGLMPQLNVCRVCGCSIPKSGQASININLGWWQCQSCGPGDKGLSVLLSKRQLVAIRWLSDENNNSSRLSASMVEALDLRQLMRSITDGLLPHPSRSRRDS